MADPILSVKSVTAGYGQTHVLRDVSLSVSKGERLAVIGRNGAGKTTLLATIMGLTQVHTGSVQLNNESVNGLAPYQRNARGIGLVPQTRDIFPSLTVEENLLAAQSGSSSLEEAYALFPRLKERRRNGGNQLSGGEQQMLAIARTLMTRPDLLMLDEPLEGLAPVICEQLMRVFEHLATEGSTTVMLVEQHVEAALSFATRVVLMANGQVVFEGPAQALKSDRSLLEQHVGVGLKTQGNQAHAAH